MNGTAERDEEVIALEALKSLSESQRAKPGLLEPASVSAQQGRLSSRMQPDLPLQPGLTQQPSLRGVWHNRKTGRWHSGITAAGRTVNLGVYDTEEEAARVYDKAALRIRGPKATLNFPQPEYLLHDGSLALDLQVEALLMEAFLGRSGNDELGGTLQQPSAHGSAGGDDALASSASVGDLVRQCLGRINRADRADLQVAAEALGPGYLRLMGLITDAGQVLAAGGTSGGGGSGVVGGGSGGRSQHGMDDGNGSGGGESGGEGDIAAERTEYHRSPSGQQQQHPSGQLSKQQPQLPVTGWQSHGRDRAPSGTVAAQQPSQQQHHHQYQQPQQQPHANLQSQPPPQLQQARQQQQQVVTGALEKSRSSQAVAHAKDLHVREPVVEKSPPPQDLTPERDRLKTFRNQHEAGTGGGGGGAAAAAAPLTSAEPLNPVRARGPSFTASGMSGAAQDKKLLQIGSVASAAPLQPELLNGLCNLLVLSIRQIQQSRQQQQPQQQYEGARPPPPPLVQAVTNLATNGFPALPLMQAAEFLARTRAVSAKDYEALEAVAVAGISERVPVLGNHHHPRPLAPAAAAAPLQQQQQSSASPRGPQQHQHQQKPATLDTSSADPSTAAAAGSGGTSAPQGLARSGSGVGLKRKSVDTGAAAAAAALTAAAAALTAAARGEPLTAATGAQAAAVGYGTDGAPASSKRRHRVIDSGHPMITSSSFMATGPPPAAAPAGAPSRATGVDTAAPMDMTTSMATAAAAASTAGGVPIGMPSAPQEQARDAAAMAAATAVLAGAPGAASQWVQVMLPSPLERPPQPLSSAPVQHASPLGRRGGPAVSSGAVSGGAVSGGGFTAGAGGPARQHIGLGRRLFNAIASQLPTGAELDCLLPPRYGFVGVLYNIPGSTRVGAGLWDGGEVINLGDYSSARDARQVVDSSAGMANRVAGPSGVTAGATQPSVAATAARRLPAAGGMLGGRPSVMMSDATGGPPPPHVPTVGSVAETGSLVATAAAAKMPASYPGAASYRAPGGGGGGSSSCIAGTSTSGQAAAPMARGGGSRHAAFPLPSSREGASASAGTPSGDVPGAQGVSCGGGGSGSGGGGGSGVPTALMRPLSGTGGGGPLPTAASNKSLLSGGRSSLAPPPQSGVGGKLEMAFSAPPRGAHGSAALTATPALGSGGELEAVGSSLPKGPVMGTNAGPVGQSAGGIHDNGGGGGGGVPAATETPCGGM